MTYRISGTGSCLPKLIVDNQKMAEFVDTSDEWITQRTGIKTRHILSAETLTDIAVNSAQRALEDAGLSGSDIDLVIASTLQGDYLTPSLACLVQSAIGAQCAAFDLNAACTGFIYALDVARAYFAAGHVRNILVVCAEAMSRIVDWRDRSTCVLFGDGAGAVVLSEGDDLKAIKTTSQGTAETLRAPVHTGNTPFAKSDEKSGFLFMDGQEVYRFAVSAVNRDVDDVLSQAGLAPHEVDYYLLHQANSRIIDGARRRIDQPESKFPVVINRFGNTSSASIPILLDDMNHSGQLKPGQTLLMCAFGAGYTTGACIINWSKQQR